jgi:16S rRNA (guanine527-N7)-methyltransferase
MADVLSPLDALAERYGLAKHQREQLEALLEILERDPRAPTTLRTPRRAIDGHLADSLVALEIDAVVSAERVVDIGAGAGFPGLALAIALAHTSVALLESQARKCSYMQGVVSRLGLARVQVVCARAEAWGEGVGAHDLALARAVGPQPVVLEYAAPLLCVGGRLVDWRGRRVASEEQAALSAARELGLRRELVNAVAPFADARERHLHVFAKVAQTSPRFPRRPGLARKRPLGAT